MSRKPLDLEHRSELPLWLEAVILLASIWAVVALVGMALS